MIVASVNVVLRIAFLLSIVTVSQTLKSACKEMKTCDLCTRKKNPECHWCPVTDTCHSSSIFNLNKCNSYENILKPDGCDSYKDELYDEDLSYRLATLCAVAYSEAPGQCMGYVKEDLDYTTNFEIIEQFKAKCDDFYLTYDQCSAILAISHKQEMLVLSYRGTTRVKQLIDEAISVMFNEKVDIDETSTGKVQEYFLNMYYKLSQCIDPVLEESIADHPHYDLVITGHSLGGAVASVAAYKLALKGIVPEGQLSIYTFGMPRVGDYYYAEEFDRLLVNKTWRIVHRKDLVPHIPTRIDTKNTSPYHHGVEILYGVEPMLRTSSYKACYSNEDAHCSNRYYGGLAAVVSTAVGISGHKRYFRIPLGTYCEDKARLNAETLTTPAQPDPQATRSKRSIINESLPLLPRFQIEDEKCHSFIRDAEGDWVEKVENKKVGNKKVKNAGKINIINQANRFNITISYHFLTFVLCYLGSRYRY